MKLFDVLKAAPIARNGYHQYTHINQVWDMKMPIMADDRFGAATLAGNFGGLADTEEQKKKELEGPDDKVDNVV